jgi:tRNA-dihydrouridine synthase A
LRYEEVYRLKNEMPHLSFVLNGGVQDWGAIDAHLRQVDGAMLGRAAYHDSYLLAQADHRVFGERTAAPSREQVVHAMVEYAREEVSAGTSLRAIARHMLGLFHGHSGARTWRRQLSDAAGLARNDPKLLLRALEMAQTASAPALS